MSQYANLQFIAVDVEEIYSQYIKTNRFRVLGTDTENAVCASLEEAKNVADTAKNSRHESEKHVFHTQAKAKAGENGFIALVVLDAATQIPGHIIDHYVAFNHWTGFYEQFATYDEAKRVTDRLRQERHSLIDSGYVIQEEFKENNDLGTTNLIWITTWVVK